MSFIRPRSLGATGAIGLVSLTLGAGAGFAAAVTYPRSPVEDISRCQGQNAEVESAVDPSGRYVYEIWIGCGGIGFARSTDGGFHFLRAVRLRASGENSWDPALAVGANGTVYAAFMAIRGNRASPVVLVSFDHGATFPRRTALTPRQKHPWGDRVFIAAGPRKTVYLTWDYGPSSSAVKLRCFDSGSCAFRAGDFNAVMQTSTDGGRTFGPITPINPGFPASGGIAAPLVVEAGGTVDVLYEGFQITSRKTLALGRGGDYFTSSADGGRTWSHPVAVGPASGPISPNEWWIDGAITIDAAGNLYATWDTHVRHNDIGWLSYSTDHGASWSAPIQVARSPGGPIIVQAAGGPTGIAYVGWLSRRPGGYRQYLSTFSIAQGWLWAPRQVSTRPGNPQIWPGDTFGISALGASDVIVSWGSAIRGTAGNSEIFAVRVAVQPGG